MMTVNEDEPLCICDICDDTFEICAEFITHLKSEEHIKELSDIVPRDSWYGKPMHFCHVCNYPGYDEYNMLLHNQSEDHHRKKNLAEKMAQEEDCESRKRNPQVDLFYERNKKQSL
ncbi:BnaC04g51300D [Brassica napus]|uniref:BnaC04g50620D protein n=1 Tax=Brassica napus TaxID=3708 RepID=A0A078GQM2_BRANA|nr:BnaC04g50620D [Brassica napus]CDY27489.1 BnaC04g51300D [Brassica napus]